MEAWKAAGRAAVDPLPLLLTFGIEHELLPLSEAAWLANAD